MSEICLIYIIAAGSGPGVRANVKEPLAKGARMRAGRFAPYAPGRKISDASMKIIVAASL